MKKTKDKNAEDIKEKMKYRILRYLNTSFSIFRLNSPNKHIEVEEEAQMLENAIKLNEMIISTVVEI